VTGVGGGVLPTGPAGTAVIVTSQCHESEVLLGHYEAGDALARSGAVGSRDMTLEAAYAKVQFPPPPGPAGGHPAGGSAHRRWIAPSSRPGRLPSVPAE